MAIYKDENEFFNLLMAVDLPLEDTERLIVAALNAIASSAAPKRFVEVDITEKQILSFSRG